MVEGVLCDVYPQRTCFTLPGQFCHDFEICDFTEYFCCFSPLGDMSEIMNMAVFDIKSFFQMA